MASLLGHIFSCCLRRRSSHLVSLFVDSTNRSLIPPKEIPDDGSNSRLIPAYPEQSLYVQSNLLSTNLIVICAERSPPTNVIVIDQQKLNDRLVTIVRSKEG